MQNPPHNGQASHGARVQATAVTARLLDLRRNPATGNRLGLALVLRFRLATVDPVDKPRTFFRFRL